MTDVAIVDYGMGNLRSVLRKLVRIGAAPVVTADPDRVAAAGRIVLPGVGHFARAMRNLETSGLRAALDEAVLARGAPILGICLGMQLLGGHSEEGDAAGLGWLDADVVRFDVADPLHHKIPHMGWNTVEVRRPDALTQGLSTDSEFYFVHAYHMVCRDPDDVVGETTYAHPFVSAVGRGNVRGVQFHPEKSHDVGETMLRNFLEI